MHEEASSVFSHRAHSLAKVKEQASLDVLHNDEDQVADDMELRFWIQGFADRVEVLGPKKLREEFKLSSKRLRNMYEKD